MENCNQHCLIEEQIKQLKNTQDKLETSISSVKNELQKSEVIQAQKWEKIDSLALSVENLTKKIEQLISKDSRTLNYIFFCIVGGVIATLIKFIFKI